MTLEHAQRIVGHHITVDVDENGFKTATAIHPEYGYEVAARSRDLSRVLGQLIQRNYQAISAIVMREQGYRCANCNALVPLEIDHIVMRSHGRDDSRANLRALGSAMSCGCHARRHGVRVAS